jgi:hypothetical protein
MSEKLNNALAVIGIDVGKISFHLVGHDQGGAMVLRSGRVASWKYGWPTCHRA